LSASFSSSSRFFSAVICSSFCRASKRSFCTSEGSAAELAAGIPPLAACNTSFMVGFFLPNRPDILLGGSTGLAAEAGVAWRRRGEEGALSWARRQLAISCVLAHGMRRVAQSTRHRNAAVFLSMTDYSSLAQIHKFSVICRVLRTCSTTT